MSNVMMAMLVVFVEKNAEVHMAIITVCIKKMGKIFR